MQFLFIVSSFLHIMIRHNVNFCENDSFASYIEEILNLNVNDYKQSFKNVGK